MLRPVLAVVVGGGGGGGVFYLPDVFARVPVVVYVLCTSVSNMETTGSSRRRSLVRRLVAEYVFQTYSH